MNSTVNNNSLNFGSIHFCETVKPHVKAIVEEAAKKVNHADVDVFVGYSKMENPNLRKRTTKIKALPKQEVLEKATGKLKKKPYKSIHDFHSLICVDRAKDVLESQIKKAKEWGARIQRASEKNG